MPGVDVQKFCRQLEIKNFQATCTVITLESQTTDTFKRGEDLVYIPAMQIASVFGTDGQQFAVLMDWEARGDAPDYDSKMGLRLRLTSGCNPCYVKLQATLVNTDPANNLLRRFIQFRKLIPDTNNFGWGCNPTTGSNSGLIKLSEIFVPSKGWLHEGTLRVDLQLQVATMEKSSELASVESNPQDRLSIEFGELLAKGNHTDVTIKVRDEELHAHSLILMARSSVFAAMLSLPMREATDRIVTIPDLDMAAVKAMISFIYTAKIEEGLLDLDSTALGILEAAHRYNVTSLVDLCVQSLCARLDVTTVSEWFHIADLIGNAALRTVCLKFIQQNITEVQATDMFAKFIATRPVLLTEILAALFPPAKKQRVAE